jgi:AcrR family transcriptional regulator
MPRVKQQFQAMRSATREKILAAGLQIFAHKGLAATSIQEIASQAGISVGLMYHYYRSKEALFTELVETVVNLAAESTQVRFESNLSPAERITGFSNEVMRDIAESNWMSQIYLLMIHYLLAVDLPKKKSKIRKQGFVPLENLKRTIIEGQQRGEIKPGDPLEMATLYFAAIQGLAISKLTMGDRFILPNPDLLSALLLSTATGED